MSEETFPQARLSGDLDTIVAQATPIGRGGIGVVRVSGPLCRSIMLKTLGCELSPRLAHYGAFLDPQSEGNPNQLDQGIALFFPAPHSFTGEDVLELQGHGGQVIMDLLIQSLLRQGARLAQPGEFSERAFLNDKLDLLQAEAIADLIDSSSEQAARSALRTLQGAFSETIHRLVEDLTELRMYVEAAIDFPEEEIDFLGDGKIIEALQAITQQLQQIFRQAQQGSTLREGMTVVVAGLPNAGKSSLLNQLAGKERAIVTDIPGTTRDLLHEQISLDGLPLHLIDTAGLRLSEDPIEQEGIRRAMHEIEQADRILLVVDSSTTQETHPHNIWPEFADRLKNLDKVTLVQNKVDRSHLAPGLVQDTHYPCPVLRISAKENLGINQLRQHLKSIVGYQGTGEGLFSARRRHLDALERAAMHLANGKQQLNQLMAGELLAEDLRLAQNSLAEITGAVTPDDLLGKIFSSFCIGK